MKYYLLYPEQEKTDIDYQKQLAGDSGINTLYLQPAWGKLILVLDSMGEEQFTENVCDPNEIIVFSEQGGEWGIEEFVDMIYKRYKFIKRDY